MSSVLVYKQGSIIDDRIMGLTFKATKNGIPMNRKSIEELAIALEKYLQKPINKKKEVYNKLPIICPKGSMIIEDTSGESLTTELDFEESRKLFTPKYIAHVKRVTVIKPHGRFFYEILNPEELEELKSYFRDPATTSFIQ